jgi:hypothetical protein
MIPRYAKAKGEEELSKDLRFLHLDRYHSSHESDSPIPP